MRQPVWQDRFKTHSLRVGFRLGLTRPMCEFLSAVGDDVQWNRSSLGSASAEVCCFLATSRALEQRGLIERKPQAVIERNKQPADHEMYTWSFWRLTPAGDLIVKLLKLADMYVESDAVTIREQNKLLGLKSRRK